MYNEIFNSPQCKTLREKLEEEYQTHKICPPRELVFSAFDLCPYENVKVVILGQDPYINENQAIGLAFSVSGCGKYKFPPSLKNIIKEVRTEFGECAVEDGDLRPWARQGVLLLNTCLTVRQGHSLTHATLGWDTFINAVIVELNKKDDIVFVLWGRPAREYKKFLTNPKNLVLEAAHPSPLSAHNGFFGCGHFKKINEFLKTRNKKPIVF
jgi:uracil-DNA glycosylase